VRSASTDATAGRLGFWVERARKIGTLRHGFQKFMSFFTTHNDAINNSVKTGTIIALNPKKVPRPSMVMLLTVVALDVDHTT
jgi:hypothetical protein